MKIHKIIKLQVSIVIKPTIHFFELPFFIIYSALVSHDYVDNLNIVNPEPEDWFADERSSFNKKCSHKPYGY